MLPRKGAFSATLSSSVEGLAVPVRVVRPQTVIYSAEEHVRFKGKRKEWREKDRVSAIAKRENAKVVKEDVSAFGTSYAKSNPKTQWREVRTEKEKGMKVKAEWMYEPAPVPLQFQSKEFTKRAIERMRHGKGVEAKKEPFSLSPRAKRGPNSSSSSTWAASSSSNGGDRGTSPSRGTPRIPAARMNARMTLGERKTTQRLRKANLIKEMDKRRAFEDRESKYKKHLPKYLLKAREVLADEERKERDHYSMLYQSRRQQRDTLEKAFQEKMAIYKELQHRKEILDIEEEEQDDLAFDGSVFSSSTVHSGAASARLAAEEKIHRTMSETIMPFGGGWAVQSPGKMEEGELDGGQSAANLQSKLKPEPETESQMEAGGQCFGMDDDVERFVMDPDIKGFLRKKMEDEHGAVYWRLYFAYVAVDCMFIQDKVSDLMPCGVFSLGDCIVTSLKQGSTTPHPFSFQLMTDEDEELLDVPSISWVLVADSDEEAQRWMAAVKYAAFEEKTTFII